MKAAFSTKRWNIPSPRHFNTFSDHIATECNGGTMQKNCRFGFNTKFALKM
jgi:hypothetical protein